MDIEIKTDILSGRVALVTGASRGNGAAIAKGLARHGAVVAITDVLDVGSALVAEEIIASGGKAIWRHLDVVDLDECARVVAEVSSELGDISILINNAGVVTREPIGGQGFQEGWRKVLDVNLDGVMNMTDAALVPLRRTGGSVVNIASIRSFVAARESAAYCASKGAVAMLTKAMATELASDGIRVNAIAPGLIETQMNAVLREDPETLSGFLNRIPADRVGDPAELAGPAVFLVSDLASYVTGVVLPVDGGLLAN
ncbi:MAG: 3-oxoacyl-ACP reductase [Rhodospirillaceae bacterium]|nr:3-oxoacyl-ACP reductase [Rhodospirillaceae bacterium]